MQVNLTRNYAEYIGSNFYVEKQYGKKISSKTCQ